MNMPGPQNPLASRCVLEVALNSSFLVNTANKIVRPFIKPIYSPYRASESPGFKMCSGGSTKLFISSKYCKENC